MVTFFRPLGVVMTASPSVPLGSIWDEFSGADAMKLQAATFLIVSSALGAAGIVKISDLATAFAAHAADEELEPWAKVVRATVTVLRGPTADAGGADRCGNQRAFIVIEGGLGSVPGVGPPSNDAF